MTIIVLLEGKIYSETDSETDFDSTNWVFFGNRCGAKQVPVWKSLAIISKEQSFSKPKLHGSLESMWIESQVENNVQQNNYQYSKCLHFGTEQPLLTVEVTDYYTRMIP